MTRVNRPLTLVALALSALLSSALTSQAQVTIIDSTTRNGSFETGSTYSWNFSRTNSSSVLTTDPPGPTEGSYYLSVESDGTVNYQRNENRNISISDTDGLQFTLTFDARAADTNGATSVVAGILLFNGTGTPIDNETALINQTLTTEWQTFTTTYTTAVATFDEIDLRIDFRNPGGGGNYTAYLDNVVLTQIPEANHFATILGISALTFIGARRKRQ